MNPSLYLLIGFFSVGTPLNLYAFYRLHCGRANRLQTRRRRSFAVLQKQLNLADLLIMLIHIPVSVLFHLFPVHLLSFDVYIMFLNNFIFQLVSNSLVSIAVDRLLVIKRLDETSPNFWFRSRIKENTLVKLLLMVVWISAILLCLPSLFLPRPQVDIAAAAEANGSHGSFTHNITLNVVSLSSGIDYFTVVVTNGVEPHPWLHVIQQAYYSFHLAAMFWIPALIITICYGSIAIILRRIKRRKQQHLLRNTGSLDAIIKFKCWSSRQAALLITVYFLCWTPYQLVTFNVPSLDSSFILHHMNIANCVINPIIYGFVRNGPPLFVVKSARKLRNQIELKTLSTENADPFSTLCSDLTLRYEVTSIDDGFREPSATLAEATYF